MMGSRFAVDNLQVAFMKMDRKLIAKTQPYELRYFAKKWGLTKEEARLIIVEHGPSRALCNAAAIKLLEEIHGS